MDKIMRQAEVIDELAERTGYYKKSLKIILDALEDIIVENMKEAEIDSKTEIRFVKGIIFGGQRVPAREARDPRTQEVVITPEKTLPYLRYTKPFRDRLNG